MSNDDINSLVWPAMRYALGRKTYVVETVCRALINVKNNIRNDIRISMVNEIKKAIESGNAGMKMDVDCWERVIKEFENA